MNYGNEGVDYLSIAVSAIDSNFNSKPAGECFTADKYDWTPLQEDIPHYPEKTQRCFCKKCGGLLGALNEEYPNVCITIASLDNPNLVVPGEQHSYKESAPIWWEPRTCVGTTN